MVGSLEFCTGALGSRLVLVLGHTKCGAVYGATKTYLAGNATKAGSALQGLLQDLGSVAQQAQQELGPDADGDAIAAHAVKVNVFHTMGFLLKFSESLREGVRSGKIQIHGGIYHLETGSVEFLGQSLLQAELLDSANLFVRPDTPEAHLPQLPEVRALKFSPTHHPADRTDRYREGGVECAPTPRLRYRFRFCTRIVRIHPTGTKDRAIAHR